MPPKPKGKKGEELESVEGLPKAFPFLVQLQYNMESSATEALLKQQLEEQKTPRWQLVTREDIIACAQAKDLLAEEDDPEQPPPEKLARAAAARLYELLVGAMKEKAARFKEIKDKAIAEYLEANKPKEEEVKGKPKAKPVKKEELPQIDIPIQYPNDDADLFVFLKDFPLTEAEALAFAQERYALNAVVNIKEGKPVEMPKPEEKPEEEAPEGEEPEEEEKKVEIKKEEQKKEEKKEIPPPELTEEEKQKLEEERKQHAEEVGKNLAFTELLQALAKKSERDSPLRHTLKVDIEFNPVLGAEPTVGAENLKAKLVETLKQLGMAFVSYDRFVEATKLLPLCQIPPEAKPAEVEVKKEEEKKEEEKKEERKSKDSKEAKKAGGGDKKEAKQPPEERKVYDTAAVYPYHRPVHPGSLDDVPSVWQLYFYAKNMEKVRQEAQTVGSVLVCLLQQVGAGQQELLAPPKLSEAEELLRVFSQGKDQLLRSPLPGSNPQSEGKAVPNVPSLLNPNKMPYDAMYDEYDFVRAQYHAEGIPANSLSESELSVLSSLLYPGKERHMMPAVPGKPASVRGAMKSEMHPFSSLPIYEFDRALLIREMEKMVAGQNPQGQWNFGDRKYEERLSKEALAEVFSRALMFGLDVLTSYYVLDDSLLVGLYYQHPLGRVLRRQWKGKFSHLPDFPNYVNVVSKEQPLPQAMLDLDDNKVGLVDERTKFLYPSDNSVIRVVRRRVAGEETAAVQVLKDGYTLGLRKSPAGAPAGELWLQFENGTKLTVGMQAQKGGDEPAPVSRAMATLTLACGLIVKLTGTGDVVQMRSDNVCKAPGEASKPNSAQELHRMVTGKGTVISYKDSGAIDVMMANGSTSEYRDGQWVGVNSRGKRRCRKDREVELEPVNCAAKTDPESLARVTLRQDGVMQVKYRDGRLFTRHKDETTMLLSGDGRTTVVEKVGFAPVRVRVDPDKAKAGTVIGPGAADALVGAEDVMMRSCEGRVAETFLPDGTVVRTYREKQQLDRPDSIVINTIHLIARPDGGVIKVKENGEVVVMTPEERVALNEKGQNKEFGKDVDYFQELNTPATERRSGVYTVRCDLGKLFTLDDEGNKFYVYADGATHERIAPAPTEPRDEEPVRPPSPTFEGPVYVDEQQAKVMPPPKYDFVISHSFRTIREPRLFVIRNDGSGSELLSERQLANYFRCRQREELEKDILLPSTRRFEVEKVSGLENSRAVSYMTRSLRERDRLQGLSFIRGIEMPKVADTLHQTVPVPQEPQTQVMSYRGLLVHPEFDQAKREAFNKDLERYHQWKEKFEGTRKAFGIGETRTPEEVKEERKIESMILTQRKAKDCSATREEIKERAVKDSQAIEKLLEQQAVDDIKKAEELKAAEKAQAEADELAQHSPKAAAKARESAKKLKDLPPALKGSEGALAASIKSRGSDAMTGTISQISSNAEFVANYFFTKKGMQVKYEPLSEEKLKELMDKAEKSRQKDLNKVSGELPQATEEGKRPEGPEEKEAKVEEQQNPIVALEPEASMNNKQTMSAHSMAVTTLKPSLYKETMKKMRELEAKEREDSENYHIGKTKDFTVYGMTRTQKPAVPVLNRPKPVAEINEQYISIDAITDRRIKTLSMSNRGYFNAPPVQTIRKQGQHQMIARALNKKQTFEELMAETNSMINYDLNDPKRRNFIVSNPRFTHRLLDIAADRPVRKGACGRDL